MCRTIGSKNRKYTVGSVHSNIEIIEDLGDKKYIFRCTKCGTLFEGTLTYLQQRVSQMKAGKLSENAGCNACRKGQSLVWDQIGRVFGKYRIIGFIDERNVTNKQYIVKCTKCGAICVTTIAKLCKDVKKSKHPGKYPCLHKPFDFTAVSSGKIYIDADAAAA